MNATPSIYNPRDVSPEQLDELLTGRAALLGEILDNLREQAQGKTRQHWLLQGQRGMGKTHLAGVIHHRVRTDPTLHPTYLPLWLGEADTYEVYSSATLLETVARRLAEETGESSVRERLAEVEGVGDEDAFFQAMVEFLSAEAVRRQRVLLVLMENLDALLESFAPKERKQQTRQFRALLLHNEHFLFISTTPTRYLDGLEDPKEPLYNHLKKRDLDHLTEKETEELLRKLARHYPRQATSTFLDGEDGRLRLRVIHRLTGGLPRSIIMSFIAAQESSGLGALVQELRTLLDTQTAYFEARLSRLPPRERKIVTTLALAPVNLTLSEIARQSRLDERSLTTLMGRLEKEGHVRVVSRRGQKGTIYELSEGLFRMWYQYRNGRPVLQPLVEFLAYWYRVEELDKVVEDWKQGAEENGAAHSVQLTLLQLEEARKLARTETWQQARERLWTECLQALQAESTARGGERSSLATESHTTLVATLNLFLQPDTLDTGRTQLRLLIAQALKSSDETRFLIQSVSELLLREPFSSSEETTSEILYILLPSFHGHNHPEISRNIEFLRLISAYATHRRSPQESLSAFEHLLKSQAAESHAFKALVFLFIGETALLVNDTALAESSLKEFLVMAVQDKNLLLEESMGGLLLHATKLLWNICIARSNLLLFLETVERLSLATKDAGGTGLQEIESIGGVTSSLVPLFEADSSYLLLVQDWQRGLGAIDASTFRSVFGFIMFMATRNLAGTAPSSLIQEGLEAWLRFVQRGSNIRIEYIWEALPDFFTQLGPGPMKRWLEELAKAPLPEEVLGLVRWHLLVAQILLEEEEAPPGATTPGNASARMPPELRTEIEAMVQLIQQRRARARTTPPTAEVPEDLDER